MSEPELDVPDDAPEADVLEQYQPVSVRDEEHDAREAPVEADPADVDEQRRELGEDDEDDYR